MCDAAMKENGVVMYSISLIFMCAQNQKYGLYSCGTCIYPENTVTFASHVVVC